MISEQDIRYAEAVVEKIINGRKITGLLQNKISTAIFSKIIELLDGHEYDKMDVFNFLIKFDMGYDFKTLYKSLNLNAYDQMKSFVISCGNSNIFYPKWTLFNSVYCYCNTSDTREFFMANCHYGFVEACKYGNIETAKWLYELRNKVSDSPIIINVSFNNNEAFKEACLNDHLDIAQWLYGINTVHINIHDEFFIKCLEISSINIVRWLFSIADSS